MSRVPFHPTAFEEFAAVAAQYHAVAPALGAEFVAEVERATARIATFPEHGSPYLAGTRRVLLRRFPFSVVYSSENEGILIVAVAHQRRRPGYWAGRL